MPYFSTSFAGFCLKLAKLTTSMAASRLNLCALSSISPNRREPFLPSDFALRTVAVATRTDSHLKLHFPSSSRRISRCRSLEFRRRAFSEPRENFENDSRSPFEFLLSIFPGGRWWRLPDYCGEGSSAGNEITVLAALQRMWELLGKDQWIVVVAFGALVIAAVSEITMPSVLASSIFSAQHGDKMVFYSKSRFLLVLCFTSGISSGLRSGLFAMANVILVKRLRQALYSALIFQDMTFFDREKVGGLTSRLGADCQQLSNVIGNNIHLIVRNTFQGAGALISLLILAWPLALSSIITCLVLATVFLLYGRYQKAAAKLTQDLTASASKAAEETLSSIRTIRVYGTEWEELGRYRHWLERLASLSLRESVAYGFWNMSFSTLFRSTQVFALLLGGMSIMTGHVSTEQLTKYVLYCEWLIYATWRVVDNTISLLRAIGSSERVFELMQLSQSDQVQSKGERLERLFGQVQFADISFFYPSRPTIPILDNIHLSVKANEVIALVGASGSGKTTLVNLLLRLYEPSNGQIYIDGFPLIKLDIRWLRENVGYVGQEPKIFHMDVKSNITYGCCDREIEQEEIERAAKLAYAHDFILSLPDGYETMVDDDNLSGGQKQRIAIARAVVRKPSILVLDEATSALDSQSESFVKRIVEACRSGGEMSETTVIMIAHRLSTVESADRIIVMDGGRIIEMGGHKELLLKNGPYSRLVKLQSGFFST